MQLYRVNTAFKRDLQTAKLDDDVTLDGREFHTVTGIARPPGVVQRDHLGLCNATTVQRDHLGVVQRAVNLNFYSLCIIEIAVQ